jgi:hypothetical protein
MHLLVHGRLPTLLALLAMAGATDAGAKAAAGEEFATRQFDASRWSREPTDCDRLAAHPADPERVTPGVEPVADLAAAIAACRTALVHDPANPRLNYQLARVLTYSGAGSEALPHLERAVAAQYPQALFVTGFVLLDGMAGIAADPCRAGALIHESAVHGRLAGLIGYPAYVLAGRFEACTGLPREPTHLRAMLAAARADKLDYYQDLLVRELERGLR